MEDLLSFLILIAAGLLLSELFRRFHLPYVLGLIVAGIIIGPYVLDLFESTPAIDFIGSVGLVFLMFMAGLEVRISGLAKLSRPVAKLSVINGLVPFIVGFLLGIFFGYDPIPSALLGIIFISSSIAIIIPTLESNNLIHTRLGKTIVTATVFEDVFSLIMLSIVLQLVNPTTNIPLPLFYFLVFTAVILLRILIPKVKRLFFYHLGKRETKFEQELLFIFAILIAAVVVFEILGMHSIIAGFFTGLVLSDSIRSPILRMKLHAISYGIFIPVFFIVIGAGTDITVFFQAGNALILTIAIVAGSIISKFASGWVGGRLNNFNSDESSLIGASTIPQLSTTLAVVFVGLETGLLDHTLVTAMVVLSVVTTFVGPLLINRFCPKCKLPENKNQPPAGLIKKKK